jgi:pyridoxamine 5'-phosphate oxidase
MDFHAIEDPLCEVDRFRREAEQAGLALPEAMTLATVSPEGRPHARTVLLKAREGRVFHFFTNYESDKGQDLNANPFAELCIHYPSLALQARVSGPVEKLSAAVSDAYFATRPRESQLGAWASAQSRPLASRETLESEFSKWEKKYDGAVVPRPAHWGGYGVTADSVELWAGRIGRLHDRARYRYANETWQFCRLYP